MTDHPWKLVGPWYRQSSFGGTGNNRSTAPIIQKYADTGFAQAITKEPQHSLRFNNEDLVNRIDMDPDKVVTQADMANSSSPIKLFLDAHSRHYLVVCELHCDIPGFPATDRKQVCEAGFVVRRRVPIVTELKRPEVASLLKQRSEYQNELLKTKAYQARDDQLNADYKASKDITGFIKTKTSQIVTGFSAANIESIEAKVLETNQALQALVTSGDIKTQLQGWKPGNLEDVGNWQEVDEKPNILLEKTFPMYPVVAGPNQVSHSANGKSLWFGLIPTSSGELDGQGAAKFDDTDLYEVRCFVKRRKQGCAKKASESNCRGEVIWSDATESYQLASPFDLDGTSHRPVNIKMPNLPALKAQADLSPPGRGASAKMVAPESSSLNFATDEMEMPKAGDPVTRPGQQICFFAIFLFFIVALFLFRLFLPILLFIFNLWFLLKLKFCIPPSIEFDAGLVASLEIQGSFGVEFDASIDAHVQLMTDFTKDLAAQVAANGPDISAKFKQPGFSITVNKGKENEKTYVDEVTLQRDMASFIANGINATDDMLGNMMDGNADNSGMKTNLTLNDLAGIFVATQAQYENITNPELAGQLPIPERGLVYFDIIEPGKVAA